MLSIACRGERLARGHLGDLHVGRDQLVDLVEPVGFGAGCRSTLGTLGTSVGVFGRPVFAPLPCAEILPDDPAPAAGRSGVVASLAVSRLPRHLSYSLRWASRDGPGGRLRVLNQPLISFRPSSGIATRGLRSTPWERGCRFTCPPARRFTMRQGTRPVD